MFDPTRRYNVGDFDDWLPTLTARETDSAPVSLAEPIRTGHRNTNLYKTGRSLKAKSLPPSLIALTLRTLNAEQCDPPLPDDEIEALIAQVLSQSDRPDFRHSQRGKNTDDEGDGCSSCAEVAPLRPASSGEPVPAPALSDVHTLLAMHGLDEIDAPQTPTDIAALEQKLRNLRGALQSADPMRVAAVRSALLVAFRAAKVPSPANLINAALVPLTTAAADALPTQPRHAVSTVSPTPVPVDLASLLNDVERFVRRYVVLSDDQAAVVTLWDAQTHTLDAFDCTAYQQVTSATARTGKTRLLEVQEPLVAHAWLTGRTSAAALVRKVDAQKPTLLLDESDAAFGGDKEYAEALRGVLNTGYRRSGRATLCVGQGANLTFRDFSTFGPKAIAGIGKLPDTVADRSIPIELKRRTKTERVKRFRERDARVEAKPIYTALAAWGATAIASLRAARPHLPVALNDRAQDVCEPLLAIAELAGGPWPDKARRAVVALMGEVPDEDINIELLHDIHKIFGSSHECMRAE